MSEQEKREYAERIAEAVRAACLKCFINHNAPAARQIKDLHLPAIVDQVKG